MNKYHKETEKVLLEHEKEVLEKLKGTYTRSLVDIKKRIRELIVEIEMLERNDVSNKSLIRSKVYQLNFQKALESQINSTLDVLGTSSVNTVSTFLKQMYEDSFITQLYVIETFGIPCVLPINVEKMLKAVNMKVDGFKFSQRLYDDVYELGVATVEAISRGIAQGEPYIKIAENISRLSEASLRRAYTIARTEGGRVSSLAKIDSQQEAKKNGADIMKVWDSTLDLKTRPAHRLLDQQKREIGEPFEVDGYKAQAPRLFGVAYLDINCRCTSLTVPKWSEKGQIKKRDNVTGEIIECDNYSDWKTKYFDKLKGE